MSLPPAMQSYLRELATLPDDFLVVFGLFAVLAYGCACVSQRRLLRSWAEIRRAVAPAESYRRRTVRFDMVMFALQMLLVMPAAGYVGSLYSADRFARWLAARHGAPHVSLAGHPIAASLVQMFASEILGGFGAFIFHYAGHKTPLFWSLHKVHHSAEAMSPFTAVRGHPLDTLLGTSSSFVCRTLVVGIALYFTGGALTPAALTVFTILMFGALVQDALNHSHVPLSYGWFDRIWVSPAFHHLHHSLELRHRDKNFGGSVPVWDWIFGTMYLPDASERYVIGLNEQEFGERNPHNSFKGYLVDPVVEFGRELGKLAWGMGAVIGAPFGRALYRKRAS